MKITKKKIHTCFRTKKPKNYSIRKYIMFILGGHNRPISYSPLHKFNTILIAHSDCTLSVFIKKKNFFAFDSKLIQLVYFGMVSSIRVHVFSKFLQVVKFKIRMTDWKQIILNIHCIFTQKASFKNCFLWQIEA